ncbi:MAG: DNA primase [Candidatus Paceibacterota bacterium]
MDNGLIEQIKKRLPIAEVLSTYITLEPSGTQFKARCPFHNEKTASFSVSPERGLFYCFGCGEKGDILTFVEKFEGLDFKGALKVLADRAGIPLTSNQYTKVEPTDTVYDALEVAAKKYQQYLLQNSEAIAYLKNRGLTDATIESFRIGYAPTEWRSIAGSLDEKSIGFYERAGLIKAAIAGPTAPQEKPRHYDRFRGRIMFPLMDSSGRIVAFSGRMFPDTPEGPKYLNSPETEVFSKSRVLFGFDKAKLAIKKHNFAILVEGQMDLVLSHQAGFKNTVATSGTAVSETVIGDASAQLSIIARLTQNLFLAFDGDSAGKKAMERAALVALSLGMNPKVVALPEGVDPADYIGGVAGDPEQSEGLGATDNWKNLLKQAEHFILHTLHEIQKKSPSAHQLKQSIRTQLFPFLLRVPSAIERQVYVNTIATESNLGTKEVNDDFNAFMLENQKNDTERNSVHMAQKPASTALTHIERFIGLVELFPIESVMVHKKNIDEFQFEGSQLILPTIADDKKEWVVALVERQYASTKEEDIESIIKELSATLIAQFLEQLRFEYSMKMNEAKQQHDEEKELQYLALLQKLHQRRHQT